MSKRDEPMLPGFERKPRRKKKPRREAVFVGTQAELQSLAERLGRTPCDLRVIRTVDYPNLVQPKGTNRLLDFGDDLRYTLSSSVRLDYAPLQAAFTQLFGRHAGHPRVESDRREMQWFFEDAASQG
jgi:hypothetical protein